MDELLGLLGEKTGLPQNTAQGMLPIISGFLKNQVPAGAAGAIDGALGNQPAVPGVANVGHVDDLASFIAQRLGIPKEVALMGIMVVGGYLKDRLPSPEKEMVGTFLGAQAATSIFDEIKGFFGMH